MSWQAEEEKVMADIYNQFVLPQITAGTNYSFNLDSSYGLQYSGTIEGNVIKARFSYDSYATKAYTGEMQGESVVFTRAPDADEKFGGTHEAYLERMAMYRDNMKAGDTRIKYNVQPQ